ncbi:hypothetical protein NDU88_006467 [Pleurodeles waltl]|uniref:Uncharacterized protein n=1 Tax=Pleurodeles waltl TaxID=8319 RepID=A0AAV7LP74_PLEWA|nr:hypothetical protein NDU88_006467 [Pleurodeles waltl]
MFRNRRRQPAKSTSGKTTKQSAQEIFAPKGHPANSGGPLDTVQARQEQAPSSPLRRTQHAGPRTPSHNLQSPQGHSHTSNDETPPSAAQRPGVPTQAHARQRQSTHHRRTSLQRGEAKKGFTAPASWLTPPARSGRRRPPSHQGPAPAPQKHAARQSAHAGLPRPTPGTQPPSHPRGSWPTGSCITILPGTNPMPPARVRTSGTQPSRNQAPTLPASRPRQARRLTHTALQHLSTVQAAVRSDRRKASAGRAQMPPPDVSALWTAAMPPRAHHFLLPTTEGNPKSP